MTNSGPGRPKNPPTAKKVLKEILPVKDIFTKEELIIYHSLVDVYMKDFDEEDLSYVDIDDIMSIAINKVLELRLLKTSVDDTGALIDISASVEKLRKQTDKVKESLSVRRKDRIDPNEFKGFSIVDLAASFDNKKRLKMEEKSRRLKAEQDKTAKDLKSHPGNRFDVDSVKKEDVEA